MNIKGYETEMTLDADSWVAILVRSAEEPQVVYFNSKQEKGELEDRHTFEDFANAFIEENFIYGEGSTVKIENNQAQATGGAANEDEEVDEDARRSYKVIVPDGMIINIYREENLTDPTRLNEFVKKAQKELSILEDELCSALKDNLDYQRNPMAYYGVSQKDFL